MKYLIATSESQGDRTDDFCWTLDGEIVCFGIGELSCDPVRVCRHEDENGPCGCKRSMIGCQSRRATTTVAVAESENLTITGLRETLRISIVQADLKQFYEDEREFEDILDIHAARLEREASKWSTGTVLERRGDRFLPRT